MAVGLTLDALDLGADAACWVTRGYLECAARPRTPTGEPAPFRDVDFGHPTLHVAVGSSNWQIYLLGQGVCVHGIDGTLTCVSDRAAAPRTDDGWPGVSAGVMGAGFAAATSGTFDAMGRGAPVCAQLGDYSVRCFTWTGRALEPRGVLKDVRELTVGPTFACGLMKGKRVCWPVSAEGRATERTKLQPVPWPDGGETASLRGLSFGGDGGCGVLPAGRVLCWTGITPEHAVEVTLPGPARLVQRRQTHACAVLFNGATACWSNTEEHPTARLVGNLPPLGQRDHLYVGSQEACVARYRAVTCFELEKNAVDLPPPPPPKLEPPNVAVAPTPPPSVVVAPRSPPPPEWKSHLALPFSFGHGVYSTRHGSSHGLWLELRGEVLLGLEPVAQPSAPTRAGSVAFGPFGEVSWHEVLGKKRLSAGAGGSLMWWFSGEWGVMPSVGWYEQDYAGQTEHGIQAGLWLGAMKRDWGALALPIGLRLDGRYGLGGQGERALLFGGEADALIPILVPVAIYLLATANWSFD